MPIPFHLDISAALASPKGYPPLSQAVFPDDRVVVVPDEFAVSQPQILAEMVDVLLEAGVDARDIAVMLTESDERKHGAAFRAAFSGFSVRIPVHHPALRQDLALLATDERDEPIAINREIVDADLVLLVQRKPSRGAADRNSALYPRFADANTIFRLAKDDNAKKNMGNSEDLVGRHDIATDANARKLDKMRQMEVRKVYAMLGIALVLEIRQEKKRTTFQAYSPEKR